LLVALISVSALAVPILVNSFRGERSILSFNHSFTTDEFAYFHFRNKGGAPGLIQSIEFVVGHYRAGFDPDQLGEDTDEKLLRSNTGGVIRISPTRLMANSFQIEMAGEEEEALLDEFMQWYEEPDDDGFHKVISGEPWPQYEIPLGGLQAKVTDPDMSEELELLNRDVYVGLYRAQYLFSDLDIKDVRTINVDDLYRLNAYNDVLIVVREHWGSLKDDVDVEMVQAYLETNMILQFIDKIFEESSPYILVRLRNSDGSKKELKIPVSYEKWRRFLRPILLNARGASREWLAFFY
jgi:hypothetical protein